MEAEAYCSFIFTVSVKITLASAIWPKGKNRLLAIGAGRTMSNFSKNQNCPDSHDLLAFQNGDMPVADSADLRAHLSSCEFCAAEVEFYSHYPQPEDTVESPEMPKPLADLAEALLSKNRGSSVLADLMRDIKK